MKNPYAKGRLSMEAARGETWRLRVYVMTQFPKYIFWLIWDSLVAWRASRAGLGKALLLGFPALLALLSACTLTYYLAVKSDGALRSRYLKMAERATYFENYETATLCYRRLIQDGETAPKLLFRAALIAGEAEHEEEKAAILGQLTHGANRYGPAHLYKARTLLAEPRGTKKTLAKQEVEKALEVDPALSEAHALLGHLAMEEGETAQAITHFEKASRSSPNVALTLASLHEREGNAKEAMRWATQAMKVFADQEDSTTTGSPEHRLAVIRHAQALALSKHYQDALSKLQSINQDGQDPLWRNAVAGVLAQWSRTLFMRQDGEEEAPLAKMAQGVQLLEQATNLSSTEATTVSLLAELSGLKETRWTMSKDALENLLGQGKTPWLLHWIAGVRAWKKNLEKVEKTHLTIALELNPIATTLLARSIYQTCSQDDLSMEDALRLLYVAWGMDSSPRARLAISDIRGALHRQKQRWPEAIDAYKAAIAIEDERPALHLALANAYEESGNQSEAAIHRGKAEALKTKTASK
ncbi:MAG: tetratricopeptide (TPR) repeat protein [Verrucomicrobiales bacterium]|jgi:tetratricopeptide (TPR) repeat protein